MPNKTIISHECKSTQREDQGIFDWVLDLAEKLPQSTAASVIAYQIIKSGTSVAANYRAACRARSDKEFLAKMNIVLEESDETQYWLEIISAKRLLCDEDILPLLREANELTSILFVQ